MLPKEYEELLKIEDVIDRDDKANELIKKVKAMIASPKIGDKIITGNDSYYGIRYEDGKLQAFVKLEMGDELRDDSSTEILSDFDITFLPTTKEVLKELANSKSKEPKWQRNVRNVLQSDKESSNITWNKEEHTYMFL